MNLRNIPYDINAELILAWLPEGSYRMVLHGQHKRNAYNDLIDIESMSGDSVIFHLGRNGLYNALPEYLFHPLNRFNNLPLLEEKERFAEEIEKQEQEKENAMRFFEPLDIQMMLYRVMTREQLRNVTETNSVLIDIIGDRLSESKKNNRFIQRTLPFLSNCRNIRGNKTLLTQMLRKVMIDEGMSVTQVNSSLVYKDRDPRYDDSLGDEVGDIYLGNIYDDEVTVMEINYFLETVDGGFPVLLEELEVYREFICDFFISIETVLKFRFCKDEDVVILGEEDTFNYLNYNANI